MFLIVKTVAQHGWRKIVVCRTEGSAEALVISKSVKISNLTGHYFRNRSHLDIGVLVFFGIV